jgi:hypothetical protein
VASKTQDAEDLLDALKRVAGSRVNEWGATYAPKKDGDQTLVRATYSGTWTKNKPGGQR